MKNKIKNISVRLFILLVGITIAHFGVTLFLLSDKGSDPFNVLVQGILRTPNAANITFLTHGNIHVLLCLIIIAIILFVDKSYIKIGTVACMIVGGPIIDMFTYLLKPIFPQNLSIWLSLLLLAVACSILAFGMTIVIKSDAGTGPNDLVGVVLSDKLHKKFGIVRILSDTVFVLAGWLLGGTIGIGTIVCVALVGPVADLFLKINEKWINAIMKKIN